MPRFYFHLRDGGQLIDDPEGTELSDAEYARTEATKAAREILGAAIRYGIEPVSDAIAGDASGAPRPQAELVNRPTHPFVCPVDESYGPWSTCDKEYGSK